MIKFEVGEQFPLHNHARGIEQPRIDMNEAFFDICFYSLQSDNDAPIFRNHPIRYGVFAKNNLPFFLIDFIKEFNLDVSINIHKVHEDKVEKWLNSSSNVINLYLIDAKTNILKAMRMISINPECANLIRDILEKQDENYESASTVEGAIKVIANNYSTDEMFENAKFTSKL